MTKRYNLGDLRAAIDDVYREVMAERGNGEALNSDVINKLKTERSSLVKLFSSELIDMALTKLLNDVCRRNAASNGVQSYLFDGYSKIPKSVTIEKGTKKMTSKLTLAEAEVWNSNRDKKIIKTGNNEFQKLIDDCRIYSRSDEETIEEIITRKRNQLSNQENMDI